MAVLDVFHWEHIQGIAKACKKMTKVTEEQLGFRTGITDEAGVAWLGICMKDKLAGECEKQRHVKKSMYSNKADLSDYFMIYNRF